jgi:tetratricopeptide (TPR) repeat protein
LAGEFVDGKFVISDESFRQLTDIGQNMFSKGDYLFEALVYSAMLDYSLTPDQLIDVYNLRSEDYEYLGHYELAIEDYLQILELGDRRAGFLNSLCWDYAITNQAELALPYCEEAVKNDPSSQTLDSRAVAYALLGKFPEAISDFEAALEQDGFPSEEMKAQRQDWVTTLKAGKNPITEQVLQQERGEETDITLPIWYEGDLSLSYLRPLYEGDGYEFEETMIDGQPGLTSTIQDGNCMVVLVLLGDGQEFKGGGSMITGCSHDDLDGHLWNFMAYFSQDLREMARALVWKTVDSYYVIEGKPVSDLNPIIGGFEFSVERLSIGGESWIGVKAKPAE